MSNIKSDLTFFDCNVFIGRHQNPYIDSPFNISILEDTMIASGLSGGLIYHSASFLYDASYGNKILLDEAKGKTEFKLVWIALPEYCTPETNAENFISQLKKNKISAVKIFPRYHNFNVVTGSLDLLFNFLSEEKIPLLADQEEISWEEIVYILNRYNEMPFLLQNTGYRMERYIIPFFDKYKNFYLDISRYQAHGGIEYLCGQFGSDRILFGSGMPVFSAEPIMMMINYADISLKEKQNISSNNIIRLLGNE